MTSPVRRVGLRGYVTLSNKKFRRFGKSCSRYHEDHWVWGDSRGPYVDLARAVWGRGVGGPCSKTTLNSCRNVWRYSFLPRPNPGSQYKTLNCSRRESLKCRPCSTSRHTQKSEPNQSVTALISWQHTLNSADITHVFHRHSTVLRTRLRDEAITQTYHNELLKTAHFVANYSFYHNSGRPTKLPLPALLEIFRVTPPSNPKPISCAKRKRSIKRLRLSTKIRFNSVQLPDKHQTWAPDW